MNSTYLQDSDFAWFIQNFERLYKEYGQCYLIISNQEVVGFSYDYATAVREANKILTPGQFIVQEVGPDESCYTVTMFETANEVQLHDWVCDRSAVLTSYPPQYQWVCKICGEVAYRYCSDIKGPQREGCPGSIHRWFISDKDAENNLCEWTCSRCRSTIMRNSSEGEPPSEGCKGNLKYF